MSTLISVNGNKTDKKSHALFKKPHSRLTFRLKKKKRMQRKTSAEVNQNYIIIYTKVLGIWKHFPFTSVFQNVYIIFR